jgi:hypothetical protein
MFFSKTIAFTAVVLAGVSNAALPGWVRQLVERFC